MWFKYGLKAQKLQKQHALNQPFRACGAKLSGRVEQNFQGVWSKTCET